MKIGFLTACLPDTPLTDLVRWASREGFQALELAAWPVDSRRDYQARQLDVVHLTAEQAKRTKILFEEYGVEISALAYYDNNLAPELSERRKYLEHLKKVIEAASVLGVGLVGTFIGGRPDKSPKEIITEAGCVFREIMKFAGDKGVRLMIENCPMENWQRFGLPGNYAYSPELWDALFNEVPDENFGLNFDPSHLYWLGIDYRKAARDYAPRIFHAHAKDTELVGDGMQRYGLFGRQLDPVPWKSGWWRYRIPGLGAIEWGKLIAALEEAGYTGVLSIEHEDPVWEGTEDKIKKGLKLGRKHLAQFIV